MAEMKMVKLDTIHTFTRSYVHVLYYYYLAASDQNLKKKEVNNNNNNTVNIGQIK